MADRKGWTREQLLVALRLYVRVPFGKLSGRNLEIAEEAKLIGRTPSALAMKACNFASLDPVFRATGRSGLTTVSDADRRLWAEFTANSEAIASEAEQAFERLTLVDVRTHPEEVFLPAGETDVLRTVRARRVQGFFRAAVLTSYDCRCAISGLAVPDLLVASHIIPWAGSVERRADPTNGICLSALFDRAFDRGLITLDTDDRVVVSKKLRKAALSADLGCSIAEADGRKIYLPTRFGLDRKAVEWHRERIFQSQE